jgi:hypothetical protein
MKNNERDQYNGETVKNHRNQTMKTIWAISGRLGWSSKKLHERLIKWGFGHSLSAMDNTQLNTVRDKIVSYYEAVKDDLDDQGRYMYRLMKLIDWNHIRLNKLLVSRYNGKDNYSLADNWRNLRQAQRRAVINTLKAMQNKRNTIQEEQ